MVLQTTTTTSGTDVHSSERQSLLTRLLDAVKQCQVRFGGRSELATEADSRVSCLCAVWESALQHGMKHSNKALSTIKQVTELTGITKIASGIGVVNDFKNMETEPAFWQYVKEHLNKHEVQRFVLLKNVRTDAGRGRAWLRSTFNEHSLEKYMHMLLENDQYLSQYYEEWALLRDTERSSMMPMMAAGLGSILFAIGIDNPELNTIKPATGLDVMLSNTPPSGQQQGYAPRADEEPMPVIAGETHVGSPQEKKKLHKKKKKIANIVSFEEDNDSVASSPSSSSVASPSASSTRSFDLGTHSARSRKKEDSPLVRQESTGSEPGAMASGSFPGHSFMSKLLKREDKGNIELKKTHLRNSSVGSLESKIDFGKSLPRSESSGSLPKVNATPPRVLESNKLEAESLTSDDNTTYLNSSKDSTSGAPVLKKQSSSKSAESGLSLTPQEEIEISRRAYAFSSGYSTQSSDSSQDLPTDAQIQSVSSSASSHQDKSTVKSLPHYPPAAVPHMRQTKDLSEELHIDTGAIVSELLATNDAAPLVPLSPEGAAVDPFLAVKPASGDDSISCDSSDVPSYNEDLDNATFALTLAQQGLNSSDRELRTQGDGSYAPEPSLSQKHENMSTEELRQAIVAMMLRKDEVEEHNKWLQCALEVEQDTVTAQKHLLDENTRKHESIHEQDDNTIQAITKENDLLKHQLRKYVSAVQMLRSQAGKVDGGDVPGIHLDDMVQPAVPPAKPSIDYSHEASEYERKLIQVAEMHGELMEFNEMLHKQLNAKEALLRLYKQELTELRGPLPEDLPGADEMSVTSEEFDVNSARDRTLINVWIPSAFLRGTGSDAYHVYQVYIRIRDEEWNIYRRYNDFMELHVKLKKSFPVLNKFQFPPKKAIGNKDARFVEGRRKKLQVYIRETINYLTQHHPQFTPEINKRQLTQTIPFFGDQMMSKQKSKSKVKERKSSLKPGASGSNTGASESTNSQYMGL